LSRALVGDRVVPGAELKSEVIAGLRKLGESTAEYLPRLGVVARGEQRPAKRETNLGSLPCVTLKLKRFAHILGRARESGLELSFAKLEQDVSARVAR
jgi:hypothetical protein